MCGQLYKKGLKKCVVDGLSGKMLLKLLPQREKGTAVLGGKCSLTRLPVLQ